MFQDDHTKKVIGGGHERDELYYLRCNDNPSVGIVAIISESLPLQWHFQLGHAFLKPLSKLFPTTRSVSS